MSGNLRVVGLRKAGLSIDVVQKRASANAAAWASVATGTKAPVN